MKNLAKIIAGGLLILLPLSLDAQRNESTQRNENYYLKKAKQDNYCISNKGRKSGLEHFKKEKIYCSLNESVKSPSYFLKEQKEKQRGQNNCFSKQDQAYNRFLKRKYR
jgi:hypothetical protein